MPDTWQGWEDSAVPPDKVGRLPARPAQAVRQVRLQRRRSTATSARAASTAASPFDLYTAEGIKNYRVVHGRGDRPGGAATAARSPASTATARPAASSCRRCSATSWCQAFREFKAIWDPDWKMNPGKMIDAYPIDDEPAARARLQPAAAARPTSPSRTTGTLRPGGAALRRRRRVPRARAGRPCAPATWSPARRSTAPAAGRTCCSR